MGLSFPFCTLDLRVSQGATEHQRPALGLGCTPCLILQLLLTPLCSQLGLFMEFNPEDMLLGTEEPEDDRDLEAELLALTGEAGTIGTKPASKGQGESVALGWLGGRARWWKRRGSSSLSWEEPARSPGPSDICPFCSTPTKSHLGLLIYPCDFPDYTLSPPSFQTISNLLLRLTEVPVLSPSQGLV